MSAFLTPDVVISEEPQYVALQEGLLNLSEENFESEMARIWESKYVHDQLHLKLLIDCLFCLSECRSKSVHLFAKVLKSLTARVRDELCLVELVEIVLAKLLNPLELSNSKCFLLLHCLRIGLFSEEDVVSSFRPYYDRDCKLPSQWMPFMAWFGNVIEQVDPVFYGDCVKQYIDIFRHTFAEEKNKAFVGQFDELVQKGWMNLVDEPLLGLSNHVIVQVIARDDVGALDRIVHEGRFNVNMHVDKAILETHEMFQDEPTLVQIAAFYGKQCFEYLRQKGASLSKRDRAGRTVIQFAVAGGNLDVVQYLEGIGADTAGVMHAAALYHQNDLFEYFFNKNKYAVAAIIPPYAGVMHCCAASDNAKLMMLCFENDVDVNSREPGGVCRAPIHIAVEKGNLSALSLLLNNPKCDIKAQDVLLSLSSTQSHIYSCNTTPLCCSFASYRHDQGYFHQETHGNQRAR